MTGYIYHTCLPTGKRKEKGFTLIELMIVVAVLSLLTAISFPKFAKMVQRAQEGRTRGNLAGFRAAIDIYYSDNEYWPYWNNVSIGGTTSGSTYPADWSFFVPQYIDEIPAVYTGQTGLWGESTDAWAGPHEGRNRICVAWAKEDSISVVTDASASIAHPENSYEYLYYVCDYPTDGTGGLSGHIWINCDLVDSRGKKIISW